MSFLAGRLAGKEGAFFFQESKKAVARLAEKNAPPTPPNSSRGAAPSVEFQPSGDVLPEVLRHSLPSKLFHQPPPPTDPSAALSTASKWSIDSGANPNSAVSLDALNPFRAYLSFPKVTFGPKRWQLPEAGGSVTASTANELRRDQYTPLNPEKLKASAEGLKQITKAFFAATTIVFGGGALAFGMAATKLQVQDSDGLKNKGKDLVRPKFENFRERLAPLRNWVENTSRKWHMQMDQDLKEKPLIKELSKRLGARPYE